MASVSASWAGRHLIRKRLTISHQNIQHCGMNYNKGLDTLKLRPFSHGFQDVDLEVSNHHVHIVIESTSHQPPRSI
jgi:hypothetical protein